MISRRQFLIQTAAATGAGFAGAPHLLSALSQTARAKRCHHYVRLFPAGIASTPGSDMEQGLIELAGKMRGDDSFGDARRISAGYTYLGQFVDHDLTLDITPLDQVRPDKVEQTENFRTPFLDLDQLYGGGPNFARFLYRTHAPAESPEGQERFLLGATASSTVVDGAGHNQTLPSTCNDLPRNSQGIALVGDARQDENLILAQLHVAFLKLHNYVLDHPETLSVSPYYNIEPRFEAARRLVTWHYQWIIRHDFLRTVLDRDVFSQLDSPGYPPLIPGSLTDFQIPVEFSAAAFRFGHSMVRTHYPYNSWHEEASLGNDLFQRTGFGKRENVPVPEDWKISWNRFFQTRTGSTIVNARKIDTRIAEDLYHLTPPQMRAFSGVAKSSSAFAPDPPELPVRTLLRGARMGLPSGEQVASRLARRMPGVRFATEKEITSGPHESILRNPKYGLRGNTPLWYYILKEAEVIDLGDSLGPVGSRIVGDVIVASLAADPNSYVVVAGKDWRPTLWTASPPNGKPNGMAELLGLLTAAEPKACNST